ncbi:hypothetical protein Bpla01_23250 [Burkholderia plantarii]|nr:hypothetical protein Bpla01_23250 [Burkholderia plantarii]
MQRPEHLAVQDRGLGGPRGIERIVGERDDRIDPRVHRLDTIEMGLYHLDRRYLPGADQFRETGCILIEDFVVHGLPLNEIDGHAQSQAVIF